MGRAPCCDEANVKRGPWSPEEDAKLKAYMEQYGTGGNWIALPQKIGLRRCGKSCRLRWLNYLRPNIKHGGFSEEEDNIICSLYMSIGSRWSIIAAQLPGRTDNDIKNYWNTKLKKKLLGKQRMDQRARSASSLKQEINRRLTKTHASNVYPHLQQPVALSAVVPYQEAHLENQASLTNMMLKIGGKLSDDHYHQSNGNSFNNHNSLFSCDISCTEVVGQACESSYSSTMPASSTSHISIINSTCSLLPSSYGVIANSSINPYYHSFPLDQHHGMDYNSSHQELDTLESFSGMDMVTNRRTITSISPESTSWGDINSLVHSPMGFNYEICQQTVQHDWTFEEYSSRFRMQQENVYQ